MTVNMLLGFENARKIQITAECFGTTTAVKEKVKNKQGNTPPKKKKKQAHKKKRTKNPTNPQELNLPYLAMTTAHSYLLSRTFFFLLQ